LIEEIIPFVIHGFCLSLYLVVLYFVSGMCMSAICKELRLNKIFP